MAIFSGADDKGRRRLCLSHVSLTQSFPDLAVLLKRCLEIRTKARAAGGVVRRLFPQRFGYRGP